MTIQRLKTCLLLGALALFGASARATTYYVATSGNDSDPGTQAQPFLTVAKGIAAAAAGDIVQVGPGTYNENLTRSHTDLSLIGAGAGLSIINGNPSDPCLLLNRVGKATLVQGFTFRNTNNPGPFGGIEILDGSPTIDSCTFQGIGYGALYFNGYNIFTQPTISNCTFADNAGNCVYLFHASPILTNCTFTNNMGDNGGAFNGRNADTLTFTNCTFTGNKATNGSGGAVYLQGGTATFSGCAFNNNTASAPGNAYSAGGAIEAGCPISIADCTFTGNTVAGYNGGGGAVDILTTITASIVRSVFKQNSGYAGGAVACNGGLTMADCLLASNIGTSQGGALYCYSGTSSVTNCTFTGNSAPIGAAIRGYNPTLNVANSIFWGDIGGEINIIAGVENVTYSNVQGGHAGTGNINADPQFVSAAGGNYRLQSTSPCIDTGSADVPGLRFKDLDGRPRIIGPAPDMGTYESGVVAAYTMANAARALQVASGITGATADDMARLDMETDFSSAGKVDVRDASRVARKAAGQDANP